MRQDHVQRAWRSAWHSAQGKLAVWLVLLSRTFSSGLWCKEWKGEGKRSGEEILLAIFCRRKRRQNPTFWPTTSRRQPRTGIPRLNWRPDLTCPDTGYSPSLVICLYSCLHISPAPILMSVIRHAAPHTSVNVNIQFANYYLSKFQNKFNPKHIWFQQFCVRNCAPSFSHLKSDKPNMEMAGDLIRATWYLWIELIYMTNRKSLRRLFWRANKIMCYKLISGRTQHR